MSKEIGLVFVGAGVIGVGYIILATSAIALNAILNAPQTLIDSIDSNTLELAKSFNIGMISFCSLLGAIGIAAIIYAAMHRPLLAVGLVGGYLAFTGIYVSAFYLGILNNDPGGMPIRNIPTFDVFKTIVDNDPLQHSELYSAYGGLIAAIVIGTIITIACAVLCISQAVR